MIEQLWLSVIGIAVALFGISQAILWFVGWWLRWRAMAKMARALNQFADSIEEALEALHSLSVEFEKMTEEARAACPKRLRN